ncbi:cytochrome P450 [Linderina pennispora]|uniref:Cytochrome P450 n=1 Tax=Linderina pennispora TaxID=61395 RepID=A0A1Y1VZZ7_9FUNG|nr:cytochrome P450 [Linderina pennispora]ORX66822.1 cytochrome P450 [Linderina pennispora]
MVLMHLAETFRRLFSSRSLGPAVAAAVAVYIGRLISRAFFSQLSPIPGPFLNKLSNLPLKYHLLRGQYHTIGEVVRIGYDMVSLSNTSDTRLVLATHAFQKGPTYHRGRTNEPTSFSAIDPELNKTRRRQLDAGAHSLIKTWDAEISQQGGQARANYFYTFHRMGAFNILQTGDTSVIDKMPIQRVPWLFPGLKQSQQFLLELVRDAIATRKRLIERQWRPATDTTSNTLSWTIANLLNYPDIHRRVTDEVWSTFPDMTRTISFGEAKAKLPYLTAVIHESMRLNPSVSGMLPRSVPVEGAAFQGYSIPRTATICVSIAACHRNPKTWENPNTFNPDRFLGEDDEGKLRDLLTFSSGVRVCIGRNLGWLVVYTVLANILRKYNFALPENAPYGPQRTDKGGVPAEIPGSAYILTGPSHPQTDCWVNISHA